jgi:hypothetical protein
MLTTNAIDTELADLKAKWAKMTNEQKKDGIQNLISIGKSQLLLIH